MTIAFNACANCFHFEAERIARGFNKLVGRTDGLIQGKLFGV